MVSRPTFPIAGAGVWRSFREVLKKTISRCPVCECACPAEVWKESGETGKVWLSRTCGEHGVHDACIATDSRLYWLSQGDPSNACGAGCACAASPSGTNGTLGRNSEKPGTPEALSTCLALIEIVDSCNLACPTCFADSPIGAAGARLKYHPLEELKSRISGVLARKGHIEILQLSGGEPTLHPQFFELLEWIKSEPGIDYCLLNTNGVRLVRDEPFRQRLGEHARRGNFQLYLQYDGPQQEAQELLRGTDLTAMKERAMQLCEREAIPFTLAMTVIPENVSYLWAAVESGLRFQACRGVSFQPFFGSGRSPGGRDGNGGRLNAADMVLGLVAQSAGRLGLADFTPLPCGDPNCAIIGYLLRTPIGVRSISEFIDFASVQGFLRDKVRYELSDLIQCGCESTELGEILQRFEMKEKDAFRLFIKPFMDAWTWDEDRIDRCCTHVIRPDGKLDSFCRYYSNFPDCR